MFRIHILEKRLKRHEEQASALMQKQDSLYTRGLGGAGEDIGYTGGPGG